MFFCGVDGHSCTADRLHAFHYLLFGFCIWSSCVAHSLVYLFGCDHIMSLIFQIGTGIPYPFIIYGQLSADIYAVQGCKIQQFEDEMTVEENSLKQVLAIPDTVEFLKAFVNGNGVIGRESESMARNNLNIKIPDCFIGYARGNTSKYKEASNRFENSVLETRERNKEIFFKNPILSDSAISIRNPKYKGIGYAEWWWLQNMRGYEYDDGLKHVQTSYPVETNYYKSEKYPEYQFYPLEFPIPGKGWYVTDNKKNLLGVQYKGFEADSLEKALMLYDFEHNAYNIKSESRGTQEWVLYNLKKRGNHKADALDWAHLGIMVGAGTVLDESQRLRYLYASGRIENRI